MAVRGKPTFQKKQKEIARRDKQQRKAARRAQRKLDSADPEKTVLQDTESPSDLDPEREPPEK